MSNLMIEAVAETKEDKLIKPHYDKIFGYSLNQIKEFIKNPAENAYDLIQECKGDIPTCSKRLSALMKSCYEFTTLGPLLERRRLANEIFSYFPKEIQAKAIRFAQIEALQEHSTNRETKSQQEHSANRKIESQKLLTAVQAASLVVVLSGAYLIAASSVGAKAFGGTSDATNFLTSDPTKELSGFNYGMIIGIFVVIMALIILEESTKAIKEKTHLQEESPFTAALLSPATIRSNV